jgi:hypothetical protein
MSRPRRVIHISLHLPHREVTIPALLLLLIVAIVAFMEFPRHHPVSPTTLDQDLALPVAEKPSNAQLADKALMESDLYRTRLPDPCSPAAEKATFCAAI